MKRKQNPKLPNWIPKFKRGDKVRSRKTGEQLTISKVYPAGKQSMYLFDEYELLLLSENQIVEA